MKLPHFIRYAPKIANLTGHNGVTVLFWTFVNIPRVSPEFVRHEYRHTVQWVALTSFTAALIAMTCLTLDWSWWWVVLSPLGFVVPYFVSVLVSGYHDSFFEKDARKYAASRDD